MILRTDVGNFMRQSLNSLSIDALSELRSEIEIEIANRTTDLQRQLDLLEGRRSKAVRPSVRRQKPGPKQGRKVAPKYRGPGGVTWSGRGLKPRWLTAAIADGRSLEDFAIRRPGRPSGGKNQA